MIYIWVSPKSRIWTNNTRQNDRSSSWWDRSRWICPSKNIVLFLAKCSHQQLGFKPSRSFPQRPSFRLRGREQDFRLLSASADTGERERGRGPRPRGAWEAVRASSAAHPSLPVRYHLRTTLLARASGPTELRGAAAVSPAERQQWGLSWGRDWITLGFQERKEGKGGGGMWIPPPWWDAGGDLRVSECSVPVPARTPSQVPDPLLLSPSRLLCAGVRHSDPPLPRGGNSSCRSATRFTGPSGKKRRQLPPPSAGPGPQSRTLHSPTAATTASNSAATPAL